MARAKVRPQLKSFGFDKYSRDPIFALVFEGALFEFKYAKPQFAPLFALPPTKRPRGDVTLFVSIY